MRTFIAACVAVLVIAAIAAVALSYLQEPVSVAFATGSVRI